MDEPQFALHARLEGEHWWFRAQRRIVRGIVRRLLPPSAEATILDVGCGTGGMLAAFQDEYRCIGMEPSEAALALARRRFPRITFLRGAAPEALEHLPAAPDLVLALDVLEHVADDAAAFASLAAATKPGGHVVLTVPADRSLWSMQDVTYGHHRRYDPALLRRLWAGLPLREKLCSRFNSRLYPVVWLVRKAAWRFGRASGQAGTDLWMPPRPVNALLEAIFAGEEKALLALLEGRRRSGYRFGVSLIAVLQRAPARGRSAGGAE